MNAAVLDSTPPGWRSAGRLGLRPDALQQVAQILRRAVVRMVRRHGQGYVQQGLGAADLFAALYFHEAAIDPVSDAALAGATPGEPTSGETTAGDLVTTGATTAEPGLPGAVDLPAEPAMASDAVAAETTPAERNQGSGSLRQPGRRRR